MIIPFWLGCTVARSHHLLLQLNDGSDARSWLHSLKLISPTGSRRCAAGRSCREQRERPVQRSAGKVWSMRCSDLRRCRWSRRALPEAPGCKGFVGSRPALLFLSTRVACRASRVIRPRHHGMAKRTHIWRMMPNDSPSKHPCQSVGSLFIITCPNTSHLHPPRLSLNIIQSNK